MSDSILMESKVLKNIFNLIKSKISKTIIFRSFDKKDMVQWINLNINNHNNFLNSIGNLDADVLLQTQETYKNRNLKGAAFQIPVKYINDLNNRALEYERIKPYGSIIHTNKMLVKCLESVLENIDEVMDVEKVTIYNTSISIGSFVGLLKQSEIYGQYSQYLWSVIVKVCIKAEFQIPTYRLQILNNYYKLFKKITNDVCNMSNNYDFLKDLRIIKKRGNNFKLYNPAMPISNIISNLSDYSNMTIDALKLFPSWINIFELIGEAWTDYQHYRMLKAKDNKEWLEAHVALLKMELFNKDPNSPEYIKLEKIISSYEKRITNYDEKIHKYLGNNFI
jgi:hypothetical protein